MEATTDNNLPIKEYDKISKFENLQIVIEKIWDFKTTNVQINSGSPGYDQERDK